MKKIAFIAAFAVCTYVFYKAYKLFDLECRKSEEDKDFDLGDFDDADYDFSSPKYDEGEAIPPAEERVNKTCPEYYMNPHSKIVHKADCLAVKQYKHRENIVPCEDLDDAIADGYRKCSMCLKD